MTAEVFDFRNLSDERQLKLLDQVKYWQFRRWQEKEWQERMTKFLNKRKQKTFLKWLFPWESELDPIGLAVHLLGKEIVYGSNLPEHSSLVHALVILHSSQTLLKGRIKRDTPDTIVITMDNKQGRPVGFFQQTELTTTALPTKELSDDE